MSVNGELVLVRHCCGRCDYATSDALLFDIHCSLRHTVQHYKALRHLRKPTAGRISSAESAAAPHERADAGAPRVKRDGVEPPPPVAPPADQDVGGGEAAIEAHTERRASPRRTCDTGRQRLVRCGTCGKACKSQSDLHRHWTVHTGARPFECRLCNKRFPRVYTRDAHEARRVCDKTITKRGGVTLFACAHCPKTFTSRDGYNGHMPVHTGNWPYYCGRCGRGFVRRTPYMEHKARRCQYKHEPGAATETEYNVAYTPAAMNAQDI